MVPRSLVPALFAAALLVSGGASAADYRPGDFLNLDLSKAVFSKTPLGPPAEFAPVAVEAKSDVKADRGSEPAWARNDLKVEPKQVPVRTVRAAHRPTRVASATAAWQRARVSWPIATAIRSTPRRWIRASRPGRAGPAAASATGSGSVQIQSHPAVAKESNEIQTTFGGESHGARNLHRDSMKVVPNDISQVGADAAPIADPLRVHIRARRPRQFRQTLSQPRRRPAADRLRHSIRRCRRRLGRGVVARGPACALARGVFHGRELRDHSRHGLARRAAGG